MFAADHGASHSTACAGQYDLSDFEWSVIQPLLPQRSMADKNALPPYARSALEILIRQIMTTSSEVTLSTSNTSHGMLRAKPVAGSQR